jgi:hypothetical protein
MSLTIQMRTLTPLWTGGADAPPAPPAHPGPGASFCALGHAAGPAGAGGAADNGISPGAPSPRRRGRRAWGGAPGRCQTPAFLSRTRQSPERHRCADAALHSVRARNARLRFVVGRCILWMAYFTSIIVQG